MDSSVIYLGPKFSEEKITILQHAHLFVLPSHSENFGIVVAEALACGTPVITTKMTPWECLVEGHCGLWIDNDEVALKNALEKLLNDGKLQNLFSKNAHLVAERFDWPNIAKKFTKEYTEIIN